MLRQTGRETKMAAVEGVSAETKLRGGGIPGRAHADPKLEMRICPASGSSLMGQGHKNSVEARAGRGGAL